eukprot:CAMPEP_0119061250 /NCGR_PEP_ID=MMETSP1178-20130426/5069_1 /TAXON_ID=33656 /ORGANISM="unid sp, Strain CCMP2000" /LENGTH=145 /DNA_ID=CAMNT_0007042441 /DNA_START=91 /DNA_END=528 /DNA_ORIENTATION=+
MAEAPSEAPESEILVGRAKPAPIRVAELVDPSVDSSPLGAALMQRKAERQGDKSLQGSLPRPDGRCDSPGWETNFSRIREDSDPGAGRNSSPQGTALLRKKIERQNHTEGKPMPRAGELQRPQLSPSSELLMPPAPFQKQPARST